MSETRYDENDFFISTMADFTSTVAPDREPDYESGSGSQYWYTHDGVYRKSDHWGTGVASCDWYLDGSWFGHGMDPVFLLPRAPRTGRHDSFCPWERACPDADEYDSVCGFCRWEDFQDAANSIYAWFAARRKELIEQERLERLDQRAEEALRAGKRVLRVMDKDDPSKVKDVVVEGEPRWQYAIKYGWGTPYTGNQSNAD